MSDPITVITAGANIIGGMNAGNAAENAAETQANAANASTGEQRRQYDINRADNLPFMQTGTAANNKLAQLLGLSTAKQAEGRDAIYNRLKGAYTNTTQTQLQNPYQSSSRDEGDGYGWFSQPQYLSNTAVDTTGLNSAVDAEYQKQLDAYNQANNASANDPSYGSLMKDFSMADFQADPGYQWRLDQGQKALERSAAARGGLLSGAAVKAAADYGQNQASAEYGNAYNRYNNDQSQKYNRLAGISGTGQTAVNQVSSAGQNMANQVSQNITGAGNARASGYVGSANAMSNGIGQAYNGYQNNQLMNRLFPTSGGSGGFNSGADLSPWNSYNP